MGNGEQSPTPFAIVADLRTGSTLLQSSLHLHPEIHCYGELFHPDDLPDNRLPGPDRRALSAGEVIRHAFRVEGVRAVGFRAMIFLPDAPDSRWADAWERLGGVAGLHVIYLMRQNQLAQYASVRIAHQTRTYHPMPGDPLLDPENRPTITIDPEAFRAWTAHRDHLFGRRRRQLRGQPSLELTYEVLTSDWQGTMQRVQAFLGVRPLPLEPDREKQEKRPLSEVITNYHELVSRPAPHSHGRTT